MSANPHDPPVQTPEVKQAKARLIDYLKPWIVLDTRPEVDEPHGFDLIDALILAAERRGRAEAQQEIERLKAEWEKASDKYHAEADSQIEWQARAEAAEAKRNEELARFKDTIGKMADEVTRLTKQRDEYRALASVGTWHKDCRPNRHKAAEEIEKSQARINQLADEVTRLSSLLAQREAAKEPTPKCPQCNQRTTVSQLLQEGMCSDCTGDQFTDPAPQEPPA